jgi:plastocyanin
MHDPKRRSLVRVEAFAVLPLLVAALLSSGDVGAAGGGSTPTVKGHVAGWEKLVPQVYADAAGSDSHRYNWRDASPTVKADFRKLSANVARDVCVVAVAGAAAPAHEPLAVKVTGGRLTPATIVLSPGSRLSFKNADPFNHVLYEVGNDKWAANPMGPGATREWSASAPGVHQIRDELFPSILMYVVVEPNAVDYAFPDRDGNFTLSVPAGEYTLKAFFDGKPVGKPVEGFKVGDRGGELREALALGGGDAPR